MEYNYLHNISQHSKVIYIESKKKIKFRDILYDRKSDLRSRQQRSLS